LNNDPYPQGSVAVNHDLAFDEIEEAYLRRGVLAIDGFLTSEALELLYKFALEVDGRIRQLIPIIPRLLRVNPNTHLRSDLNNLVVTQLSSVHHIL